MSTDATLFWLAFAPIAFCAVIGGATMLRASVRYFLTGTFARR